MKIREINLTNFKRFSQTTITNIPANARLVLLVGPNGCGKSSLIDAVTMWHRHSCAQHGNWDESYHRKQVAGAGGNWQNAVNIAFHDPQPETDEERRKAVYARSAYRNDPEFELNSLNRVDPAVREFRFQRLIDNDQAVSLNYRRLVSRGFEDVYELAAPELTIGEFREASIGSIRDAMERLFPGLVLNSLGNPLSAGTFRFDKGDSTGFLYKNLSGGDKAAFDLLLDILIKRAEFDDTVFFIDEPEAHVATALQGALLDELVGAIPDTSQLWLATHSLGMMRRARAMAEETPESVVFIDFDNVNFDAPATLVPSNTGRPFWKRAMQIALDDLAGYVTPEHVVLCEGGRMDGGTDFDADCYNQIFSQEFLHVMFLGAGNSNDIETDPRGLGRLLTALAPGVQVTRIVDRDDRSDDEVNQLLHRGVRVLTRRTIESYLLDDAILTRVCEDAGFAEVVPALIAAKAEALQRSVDAGGPVDDWKRPAGEIYNAAKQLMLGRRLGSNNREFMRAFCAPQVSVGTDTYDELRMAVFG